MNIEHITSMSPYLSIPLLLLVGAFIAYKFFSSTARKKRVFRKKAKSVMKKVNEAFNLYHEGRAIEAQDKIDKANKELMEALREAGVTGVAKHYILRCWLL